MANLSDYLPTTPVAPVSPWETVDDGIAYNDGNVTISGNLTSTGIDDNATSTAITIDANGAVGIGTLTPSGDLHVFAGNGGEQFISSDNSAMRFVSTGGVNYIQSGTATSSSSPADLIFTNVGGSGETMRIDTSGNLTATGNVTAYSDERLKSDVETLDGSKVYDMRGVSFTKDGEAGSGVIAQELQMVAPELVHEGGEYLSVAYGNLVGYLIEAVKDLKAEVEELKGAK